MIVRSEDFEAKTHPVLLEPGLPEEFKRELKARGMADTMNGVECMEIVDECFSCGKKLTTPYVYWQGLPHALSLHPQCAARLALGLAQDGYHAARGATARDGKGGSHVAGSVCLQKGLRFGRG